MQARGLEVRVQRSFRQEPDADTLLRLLYDYIRKCGKTGYPHPHRDAALSNYTGPARRDGQGRRRN